MSKNPAPARPSPAKDAAHILVVDDDDRLRDLLRRFLADSGFRVSVARDAAQARTAMEGIDFDLMVLDVMMPGESGMQLARALRADAKRVPILMLTAMGEPEDRIRGLESGVDDYLAKPFEPRELTLRIAAILRRANEQPKPAAGGLDGAIAFGRYRFDAVRGELTMGEKRLRLTEAEIALLRVFAERLGQPLSREELAQLTGGSNNTRTIDVQVTRLRRKIEPDPRFPQYLQTVRGRGYRLTGG